MPSKLKLYVGRKVIDCLQGKVNITQKQLKPLIQIGNQTEKAVQMNLSLTALERQIGIPNTFEILKIQPDDIIQNIKRNSDLKQKNISFEISKEIFIKDVLENCAIPDVNSLPKTVVVEFSSPNIAKPFHMGHLRSTIIGNFISNLHSYLNNKVTRLNYLGDWGTQFGFIKIGIDELEYTEDEIKKNPMQVLYESYVYANKLGESDPEVLERARQKFSDLEKGSPEISEDWKSYIDYTKKELESTYNRIGIKFDEYHYESMYKAKEIEAIINKLSNKNILETSHDGRKIAKISNRNVTLVKSDGSTLYLTRDIAAAIDRYSKYKFDRMYYVAENGQNDHFNALKGILLKMDMPWAERLHHVKFGRIRGMSTRKGTAVFLRDILDECRELMIQKQIDSPTTRVPTTNSEVSDILGISCIIVNDLKQRRQKDYNFSWEKVLQVQGDSGVKLQYTHSRLCSLEENCGVSPTKDCIPELLDEPEAVALIREMARFQDIVYVSLEQLEACVIVTYLFHLCNHISKALKVLRVKEKEPDVAQQRLLLFNTAREILHQGMTILGLQPLKKM